MCWLAVVKLGAFITLSSPLEIIFTIFLTVLSFKVLEYQCVYLNCNFSTYNILVLISAVLSLSINLWLSHLIIFDLGLLYYVWILHPIYSKLTKPCFHNFKCLQFQHKFYVTHPTFTYNRAFLLPSISET